MDKRTTLRAQRKLETREQIQRAARELITERGFEKTTMRALARKAGVGLGTIGLHFQDKTSLLFSTFFDEIDAVFLNSVESVTPDASLREQLLHMLRTMYGYYGRHTQFLRSVVKEALFATGEWKERFDQQIERNLGIAVALIEQHKATGEVRADVSAPALAQVCWSLYLNGLIDGLTSEHFDVEAQVGRVAPLLDVALSGVLAEERS